MSERLSAQELAERMDKQQQDFLANVIEAGLRGESREAWVSKAGMSAGAFTLLPWAEAFLAMREALRYSYERTLNDGRPCWCQGVSPRAANQPAYKHYTVCDKARAALALADKLMEMGR